MNKWSGPHSNSTKKMTQPSGNSTNHHIIKEEEEEMVKGV
jgi:hypothetical protein